MSLNTYLQETQRLLGDQNTARYNVSDIKKYVNIARSQIAAEGQCVRVLPPISSSIQAISIVSAGQNYVNPILAVSAPDSAAGYGTFPNGLQATASCLHSGGMLTNVMLVNPGNGYFQPQVTVTDASGSGTGAVIAAVTNVNTANTGQEVYPFSQITSFISGNGVSSVLAVNSIALIWGTFRYVLMRYSFSKYQAYVRNYTASYQYIPAVFSQFGQGNNGSVYMYPLPNELYQMEWDCICLPADLNFDTDTEAVPYPWTDVIPYYAAHLAWISQGDEKRSEYFWQLTQRYMERARRMSTPRGVINWYGRSG